MVARGWLGHSRRELLRVCLRIAVWLYVWLFIVFNGVLLVLLWIVLEVRGECIA